MAEEEGLRENMMSLQYKESGDGGTSSESSESVDPRTENTGRWTAEEHELFMQGLRIHNKQWKLIAELIKTRTVVQIRTHAQKYFQKLLKLKSGCELNLDNIDSVLDSSIMSTIKAEDHAAPTNSPRVKRKQAASKSHHQMGGSSMSGSGGGCENFVAACFTDEYLSGGSSSQYLLHPPKALASLTMDVTHQFHSHQHQQDPYASAYVAVGEYGNFPLSASGDAGDNGPAPTAKRIGVDVPSFHVGVNDAPIPRSRSGSTSAPLGSPTRNKRKGGGSNGGGNGGNGGASSPRNRSTSCVGLNEDGTVKKGIVKSRSYSGVGVGGNGTRPRSKSTTCRTNKSSSALSAGTSCDSYDRGGDAIGYELDVDCGFGGLGHDFPIDWLDHVVSGGSSGVMPPVYVDNNHHQYGFPSMASSINANQIAAGLNQNNCNNNGGMGSSYFGANVSGGFGGQINQMNNGMQTACNSFPHISGPDGSRQQVMFNQMPPQPQQQFNSMPLQQQFNVPSNLQNYGNHGNPGVGVGVGGGGGFGSSVEIMSINSHLNLHLHNNNQLHPQQTTGISASMGLSFHQHYNPYVVNNNNGQYFPVNPSFSVHSATQMGGGQPQHQQYAHAPHHQQQQQQQQQQMMTSHDHASNNDSQDHEIQVMAMDLAAWLAVDPADHEHMHVKSECKQQDEDMMKSGNNNHGNNNNNGNGMTTPLQSDSFANAANNKGGFVLAAASCDQSPSSVSTVPLSSSSTPSPGVFHLALPTNVNNNNNTLHIQHPNKYVTTNVVTMGPGQTSPPGASPQSASGGTIASPRNFFKEPPTLLCDPFCDEVELASNTVANSASSFGNSSKSKRGNGHGTGRSKSNLFPEGAGDETASRQQGRVRSVSEPSHLVPTHANDLEGLRIHCYTTSPPGLDQTDEELSPSQLKKRGRPRRGRAHTVGQGQLDSSNNTNNNMNSNMSVVSGGFPESFPASGLYGVHRQPPQQQQAEDNSMPQQHRGTSIWEHHHHLPGSMSPNPGSMKAPAAGDGVDADFDPEAALHGDFFVGFESEALIEQDMMTC